MGRSRWLLKNTIRTMTSCILLALSALILLSLTGCFFAYHQNVELLSKSMPPVKLAFSTEPSTTAGAGITLSTLPVVEVEDVNGNVVSSASNTVSLAAYTNSTCTTPASGTFSNNALSASSGVASFTGVNYGGTAGTTIYIGATATGLTSACSSAITITPGNPAKLIFSTQPADPSATAGVSLATQPAVTVEDTYGNVVTSATNAVTLSAFTNSACTSAGSGTFNATTNPVTPTSGVASFAGVNYTKSGTFYVGATSSGLTSACSNAISVAAGPPSQLIWTTAPWAPWVNQCAGGNVGVEDQYGNTATVSGSALTVTFVPGGSAKYYSDSACSSLITTSTISVGSSKTSTIYLTDSVSENEGNYATASGLTQTPTVSNTWKLDPVITAYSATSFTVGTCQQVTVTFEDAKGATTAIGGGSNSADLGGITAGASQYYTDSSCTTALTSPLWFSSGATSATLYAKDTRAESFDPFINWGQTSGYLNVQSLSATQLGTTVTVNPDTPQALILTGPTFEPPGTCVPITVTSVDQYSNPSPISGSALTVNLSGTGSPSIYSDSSCSTSASSISINVGTSSQAFYVKDATSEISTLTAAATSFTSGSFNLDSTSTSLLTDVSTVGNFTCAVVGGAVKCWGNNAGGNLGNGTTTSSLAPVTVSGLTNAKTVVLVASSGWNPNSDWACALKTDNTVWCWGDVSNGSSTPVEIDVGGSPLLATSIALNPSYDMCATSTSGALYCWGYDFGDTNYTAAPETILSSTAMSVVDDIYCVILTGGDLNCWGGNGYGQVGNGTTTTESSPVQVTGLTTGVVQVVQSSNNGYTARCALTSSGAVSCWGSNQGSVLPSGNSSTPVAISSLSSGVSEIIGISSGDTGDSFCAVDSGALYCWGYAMDSGKGIDNGVDTSTPTLTQFSNGVTDFSAAYYSNTEYAQCAIVSGNLECWGNSFDGALGTGTVAISSTTPVYPMSLE